MVMFFIQNITSIPGFKANKLVQMLIYIISGARGSANVKTGSLAIECLSLQWYFVNM